MKFITINGHEIKVKQNSPSNSPESGKITERGPFGNLMGTRNFADKNVLNLTTTTLVPEEAKAIVGLIRGYGHSFSFDSDLYSDGKGLSPSNWSNVSLLSGGKFGGYLKINPGGYIKYDFSNAIEGVNYTDEWTILLWRKLEGTIADSQQVSMTQVNTSTPIIQSYSMYCIRSDNKKFWNGEEKPWLDTSFLSMNNGLFSINGDNSSNNLNILIDDLVVLPFLATSQMISSFFNFNKAFSKLPHLKIGGEVVDKEIICEGQVSKLDYKDYFDKGQWIIGRILDLILTEV